VASAVSIVTATGSGTATALCPTGSGANSIAIGGGGEAAAGNLTSSIPVQSNGRPTGWTVKTSLNSGGITAYVICSK
jgi:hypothetical protein